MCLPVSNLSPIHPIHPIHLIHFCSTGWIVCSRTIRQWTTQHKQQGHWPSPSHRIADKVFFVLFWFLLVLGSCSFSSPQICIGIETKQCLHIISVHAPLSHFFFVFFLFLFLFSLPPISLSNWTCTLFFFLSLSTAHHLTINTPSIPPEIPTTTLWLLRKKRYIAQDHTTFLYACVNVSMCPCVHMYMCVFLLCPYFTTMIGIWRWCRCSFYANVASGVVCPFEFTPTYHSTVFSLSFSVLDPFQNGNGATVAKVKEIRSFFLSLSSSCSLYLEILLLSSSLFYPHFPTHQPSSISYIPISNISCLFTYYLSTLCANTPLSFLFASHVSLSLTRLHYFYLFLEPENNNQKETSLNLPLCVAVSQQPKEKKRSRTAQRPLCLYFPRLPLSYVVFFVLIAVTQSLGANNPISFSQ